MLSRSYLQIGKSLEKKKIEFKRFRQLVKNNVDKIALILFMEPDKK